MNLREAQPDDLAVRVNLRPETKNLILNTPGNFYSIAKKIATIIVIFLSIQIMNQFLILSGSWVGRQLIDIPDPKFWVGVYQQFFQAFTAIVLFYLFFKTGVKELGINARNANASIKYFGLFVLAWISIIILYVWITHTYFPQSWASMTSIELPPFNTIIMTLLFQSFFPGLGEELLFRGFIVTVLAALVFTRYRDHRVSKMGIIFISSLCFATAHIYFTLSPFRLTHIDYLQLATAFGCGAFYAVVYLKTKSLLAPFLAHNFANTSATIAGYIISAM